MISTVTTTTVTTVTTVTSVIGIAGATSLIAILAFLVLLVQREALSYSGGQRNQALARGLSIGLIPLGMAFAMISLAQIISGLR